MPYYICLTCGTQFAQSDQPPAHCPICEDERQYVNHNGQTWTTLEELRPKTHMLIEAVPAETHLHRLKPEPKVGIGQFAHLIQTPNGNILWDCVPFIDDATVQAINDLGGISAIAISHPHFHTVMVDWSRAFNDAPIYIHAGNRVDVVRSDPAIRYWEGEIQAVMDGITLIHCGGHFAGSSVLHWRGALFTGDTIYTVADPRYATFMYSYPNYIPMSPAKVRRIVAAVEPFAYDRLYAGFGGVIDGDAKAKVKFSAERYIRIVTDGQERL
jgi:glyoxylase-like metal-dependent hydrolase (beta-lactamase superfamily II)